MSDSLLNLLEILDEVVAEQESGGGAPTLGEIYEPFVEYFNVHYGGNKGNTADKNTPFEKFSFTLDEIVRASYKASSDKETKMLYNFKTQVKNYILADNLSLLQAQQGPPSKITHIPASQEKQNFYDKVYHYLTTHSRGGEENVLLRKQITDEMQSIIPVSQRQNRRPQYFGILFQNLKNGIGIYSMLTLRFSELADSEKALDYLDFKSMIGEIDKLSKQLEDFRDAPSNFYQRRIMKYLKNLDFSVNRINDIYKPLFVDLTKATFNEIFEIAYSDREKREKWKNILPQLIAASGTSLSNMEEYKGLADEWVYKFLSRYRNFFSTLDVSQIDQRYASMISDIEPNLGKTFTSPKINLSGGSLSDDFLFVVNNFFDSNANDFDSRLKQFDEKISIFLKDSKELEKEVSDMKMTDFMNRVLLMDYFVEFSKGFTNQIAGTLFEYFLAGLFNGEVIGQFGEVTDFVVGEERYSAKFLAQGSSVVQSLERFEKEEGETITYIVGKKLKSFKAKNKMRKKNSEEYRFDVDEIHDLELYKFKIKYVNGKFFVNDDEKIDAVKANLVTINTKREVVMDKIINQSPPFTQIRIMSTDKDTIKAYRETLKGKLKTSTDKLVRQKLLILKRVQAIFDNLKEGESSARKYVSSGDKEQGTNAIKKLDTSKNAIKLLSGMSDEYKMDSEPSDA